MSTKEPAASPIQVHSAVSEQDVTAESPTPQRSPISQFVSPAISNSWIYEEGVWTRDDTSGSRVTVVGAGPVGRMIALLLAEAGVQVRLLDDGSLTTPFVNAGWSWPYHATEDRANRLAISGTLGWLALERYMSPGVITKEATVVQRGPDGDRFAEVLSQLPDFRRVHASELHPGMVEGVAATSVVVPAGKLLPDLDAKLARLGVRRESDTVSSRQDFLNLADEPNTDAVINATGLGSAWIFNDRAFRPTLGTVARVRQPWDFSGVHAFATGTTYEPYAITQSALGIVVIGGTTIELSLDQARRWLEDGAPPSEDMAEFLRAQISQWCPALAGAELIEVATALRPVRTRILLGTDERQDNLIHATGLGGFGVTAAPAVARLVLDGVREICARREPRRGRELLAPGGSEGGCTLSPGPSGRAPSRTGALPLAVAAAVRNSPSQNSSSSERAVPPADFARSSTSP